MRCHNIRKSLHLHLTIFWPGHLIFVLKCLKYFLDVFQMSRELPNPRPMREMYRGFQLSGTQSGTICWRQGIRNSKPAISRRNLCSSWDISTGWSISSDSWVGLTLFYQPSCPAAQPVEFCWFPISTSCKQNQQRMEQPKSKSPQPNYPSRWTTL